MAHEQWGTPPFHAAPGMQTAKKAQSAEHMADNIEHSINRQQRQHHTQHPAQWSPLRGVCGMCGARVYVFVLVVVCCVCRAQCRWGCAGCLLRQARAGCCFAVSSCAANRLHGVDVECGVCAVCGMYHTARSTQPTACTQDINGAHPSHTAHSSNGAPPQTST